MRKLQCDLCGGPLTVQAGGQRAVCGNCGLEYPMERLRELLSGAAATKDAPVKGKGAADSAVVRDPAAKKPKRRTPCGFELRMIRKSVAGAAGIDALSLKIPQGGCTILTTDQARGDLLVRLIAGLEPLDGGDMRAQGANFTMLQPKDRPVGIFLGSGSLLDHMSVYENIAFFLKNSGKDAAETDRCVRRAAALCGVDDCLDVKPKELLPAQKLGCGIARAAMHVKPGGPLVGKLFPCPPPDVAGWLCGVLNRLRAEWPATVLLVTDHAEYLDALEADVVQLPQAEPVFDALWEPLPDTL